MSKKHVVTRRTKERKRAVDVIFEADQRGMGRNSQVLRDLLRERKVRTAALTPLPDYSVRIIEGVADSLSRIDRLIDAHAKVNGLDRMPAVDLAVMRVATWEMLANADDVPPLVAINEAIAIVKLISTDSSPAFVNAVLDAIRRDVETPGWSRQRVTSDGAAKGTPVGDAEGSDSDAVSADVAAIVAETPAATSDTEADADAPKGADEPAPAVEAAGADVDDALAYADELLRDAAEDASGAAPSHVSRALSADEESQGLTVDDLLAADLDDLDELLGE